MLTEASAAVGGIKAAVGMAKGISALKSATEINQAVIDIQRTLLDAQDAALADKELIAQLNGQIGDLRARLDSAAAWTAEKERYTLTESPLGAFTYDLRPERANGETPHRLCVTCFDNGKRSILHTKAKHSGGEIVHCATCKSDLTLAKFSSTIATIGRRKSAYSDWLSRE